MNGWHRGRTGFVVAAVLLAAGFVSVALWLPRRLGERGSPDFAYHLESSSEQHQLVTDVNLSDGMSVGEAVQVADALFEDCMGSYSHEVVSANMSERGIWSVEMVWDGGHWFRAIIDPISKTIVYGRCK